MKRSSLDSADNDIATKRSLMSTQMSDTSLNLTNNRMKVDVRVRPFNQSEQTIENDPTIAVVDNHSLIFYPIDDNQHQTNDDIFVTNANKSLNFTFDRVFDETVDNSEVYEQSVKGLVSSLLDGYNCAVFAYGVTGSGKTHTMFGSADDPGVIFLTINDLFRQLNEKRSDERSELSVSYFEIYNEVVVDLLDTTGNALTVRDDSKRGVIVNNLSVHNPKNENDLLEMLENGNKNRTKRTTDASEESYRSDTVFQISIKKQSDLSSIQISKMSLIDLSGSERETVEHNSNRSKRLHRKGANINKSLLAFQKCITALANNNSTRKRCQYIPYRDSKLTLILRDCLGGNCQTVLIATISPSSVHCDDTHNTLVYANRAIGIQLDLSRNSFSPNDDSNGSPLPPLIDLNTPKTRKMSRNRNTIPKPAEQILDNVRTSDITKHALFIQDVKRNKETFRKSGNGVYFCHLCGKDNGNYRCSGKSKRVLYGHFYSYKANALEFGIPGIERNTDERNFVLHVRHNDYNDRDGDGKLIILEKLDSDNVPVYGCPVCGLTDDGEYMFMRYNKTQIEGHIGGNIRMKKLMDKKQNKEKTMVYKTRHDNVKKQKKGKTNN